MADTRLDIQGAPDRVLNFPGRGFMIGFPTRPGETSTATTGVPTNAVYGFAPGALFINFKDSSGAATLYQNVGTLASATWALIASNTGSNTFATLYVTTALKGGTTGLTINAANTGNGTFTLGTPGGTDTGYLGSASTTGNASAALGLGAPLASDSVGFANVASGGAITGAFNSTGGVGSSSYTYSNLIYMLKVKGILAA